MKQKRKTPWWLWVLGAVLLVGGCNALLGGPPETEQATITQTAPQQQDTNFPEVAQRYFSSAVTAEVAQDNGVGRIVFKKNPDYFETGDKISKIMAIESARLFREVPGLTALQFSIPASDGTHEMSVTRQQLEDFYGGPMSRFADLDAWRNQFLPQYDTKESRAAFVQKFVQLKQ